MTTYRYCEACGARDPGSRFETACDVCDKVIDEECRSELRVAERVAFTLCLDCVARALPHAAIKVEELMGGPPFGERDAKLIARLRGGCETERPEGGEA